MTPIDQADIDTRLTALERKVERLWRELHPPKPRDPSVGIYYRDGKPQKGKVRR